MRIRDDARKLAMASLYPLVVLSVPVGMVHAASNDDFRAEKCKAGGHVWDDAEKQCAHKPCPGGGRDGP